MTGSAPTTVVASGNDLVRFTVDVSKVQRFLGQIPRASYYWLRTFFHNALFQHRKHWLEVKGTKFGRGGGGIQVGQINDHKAAGGPLSITYRVSPEDRRANDRQDAVDKLNRLSAEVFTGNTVLPVHQFGQDIRSSRFMAIAIKTRPKTPARWSARYPDKKLVVRPSKKSPNELLLYELIRVRGRGRPRKDGKGNTTLERLRLRFLLTKFVDMKPTLKMYEAWEGLETQRNSEFAGIASNLEKDLAAGDPRDA